MVYLTRKMYFSAAHRLYDTRLSPAENEERFGSCANLHGHNYLVEVTYAGEPDEDTGMLIHLSDLDANVKQRVIAELDHKNLNEDVPLFKDVIPTTENVAKYLWEKLADAVPSARLHRIRLHEDHSLFVDYYGED
jgi:6-pyruvoyltetrahydropterin/6-carboxytetrahydropterin synthase